MVGVINKKNLGLHKHSYCISEDMLEFLKRLADVDGLARVKHSSPRDYFDCVATKDSGNLCRWVGELYLELHRGTYTTHAKVHVTTQSECVGSSLMH